MSDFQLGDHIHPLGISNGRLEPSISFDHDLIDERLGWSERKEDSVSFSDMAAAFSLVLGSMIGINDKKPRSMAMIGAMATTLQFFLDPTNCRFTSLEKISREANCSRAALSKWLIDLRDQLDMTWQLNKLQGTRENYQKAQLAAVKAGVHSSHIRKQKQLANADAASLASSESS